MLDTSKAKKGSSFLFDEHLMVHPAEKTLTETICQSQLHGSVKDACAGLLSN